MRKLTEQETISIIMNEAKEFPSQLPRYEVADIVHSVFAIGKSASPKEAVEAHRDIAAALVRKTHKTYTISCRKGCSACCEILVSTNLTEMGGILEKHADKVDWSKVEKQAQYPTSKDWISMSKEDRTCVFLKNGECSIYDDRPVVCREYMVVSDPELCDLDSPDKGKGVKVVTNSRHKAITTAFCAILHSIYSIPRALLALREKA